jgi:hypothetical protein
MTNWKIRRKEEKLRGHKAPAQDELPSAVADAVVHPIHQ